jgi:hypothetical protein
LDRSILAALATAIVISTGCASTPSPGPVGRIVITVAPDSGADFSPPIHWARAIAADGTVVAEWKTEGGIPVEVPAGTYEVQAFTVFLGDTLVCVGQPIEGAEPQPAESCSQPTLGPAEICLMQVEVAPGADVRLRYAMHDQGSCNLGPDFVAPT